MRENYQKELRTRKAWLYKLLLGVLLMMLVYSPNLYAAQIKDNITVEIKSGSLQSAFTSVEQKTNMRFLYSNEDVAPYSVEQMSFQNEALETILNKLLEKTELTWKIQDGVIMIKKKDAVKAAKTSALTISGKVADKQGYVLPGVSVLVKGTSVGTTTDMDGNFSLKVDDADKIVLTFSFIGMAPKEVAYNGQKMLNVVLEEEASQIEEVVVTGYFTRRKDSYTGSATTVSGEKLREVSTGNILTTLSTIDPSFKLMENIEMGSNPNAIPEFQIHGSGNLQSEYENSPNMPTFILDGFEVSSEKVFDLDPNRVESITVLKDAAATAIYGSRAANGVVVVETKAPEMGELRVSYNFAGDFSFADLSDYDLMNATEKLEYERLAGLYTHYNVEYMQKLQEQYNERLKLVQSGVNTDWIKKPINSVGFSHKHSLLLEGGDERLRYGVNLTYQDESGVMKKSGRENIGIGVQLQYRYKNLRFMNNLTYDNVTATDSPYGTFSDYTYMNPYLYPYDENGNVKQVLYIGDEYALNPMYNATLGTKYEEKYQDFIDNFSVEWDVFEGFKLKGAISLNKKTTTGDTFLPASHTSFYEKDLKGSYTKKVTETFTYDANVMASYIKGIDKHLLNATVVWNIKETSMDYFSTTAYNYPNDNMDHIGMGVQYQEGDKPSGDYQISRLMGIVGNFNYSYDNRYLADFSIRSDGSSMFGSSKRWGTFGSVGLAWNMHNESWLRGNNLINELKIRGSWGTTGGQNFYPYQAMMMYSYKDVSIDGISYDGYLGTLLKAFGNPDLKWQSTEKLNVGIDFALLNNRLTGYFNVYRDVSKSVLTDVLLAPSLGFESYKDNLGEIENKGIELSLRATLYKNVQKGLQWDVFANVVRNKNKLLKLNDALAAYNKTQDDNTNSEGNQKPVVRYQEGQSINTIWANESLGIDPNTGEEVFLDMNGNKVNEWSTDNYKPMGCKDPDFYGNFGTLFMYKGFQLSAYFSYSYGGDIYNQTLVDKVENVDPLYNADRRVLYDRWKQPGDVAKYKAITNTTKTMPTSRFIEQENYVTLSSLNLSYEFGQNVLKNLGVERLKLSLIGNDVFRVSTVKMERGTSYPYARSYSISAQVTF